MYIYLNYPQKIVATIEARMTSTRLPGKVMLPLEGKPVLQRIIERLQRSRYLDDIVVATTEHNTDDILVELTKRLGVRYFRGSEEDVLGRVLGAAQSVQADITVEASGDCPLIDVELVDRGIEMFFEKQVDYLSNCVREGFPLGVGIEIFPTAVLKKVERSTSDPIDRAHVSNYIYQHPEKYKLFLWTAEGDYFWPELRVTLDEQADYELIQKIYKRLLPKNEFFSTLDIIRLMKKEPELALINKHVRQKELREG